MENKKNYILFNSGPDLPPYSMHLHMKAKFKTQDLFTVLIMGLYMYGNELLQSFCLICISSQFLSK